MLRAEGWRPHDVGLGDHGQGEGVENRKQRPREVAEHRRLRSDKVAGAEGHIPRVNTGAQGQTPKHTAEAQKKESCRKDYKYQRRYEVNIMESPVSCKAAIICTGR